MLVPSFVLRGTRGELHPPGVEEVKLARECEYMYSAPSASSVCSVRAAVTPSPEMPYIVLSTSSAPYRSSRPMLWPISWVPMFCTSMSSASPEVLQVKYCELKAMSASMIWPG